MADEREKDQQDNDQQDNDKQDNDKQDDDKQDDDKQDDDKAGKDASRPNEERLEELGEEIEHAKRDSDEAVHGSFYEGDQPMFSYSGEESREDPSDTGEESKSDDQTIAP